jgi:hypothetical protein
LKGSENNAWLTSIAHVLLLIMHFVLLCRDLLLVLLLGHVGVGAYRVGSGAGRSSPSTTRPSHDRVIANHVQRFGLVNAASP